jgi:hypothetical protein
MRRSISILVATTAIAAFAAPVVAQETARGAPEAPRAVYVCASDATTSRSFEQRHGVRPTFVSADQARTAAANGERWATPRCMSDREHRRLVELARADRVPG